MQYLTETERYALMSRQVIPNHVIEDKIVPDPNTSKPVSREVATNVEQKLAGNTLKKGYMNPGQSNPLAFRDFDLLLSLLRERNVQTLVLLTPAVDMVREHWQRTGFVPREHAVREQIRGIAQRYDARGRDTQQQDRQRSQGMSR